MGSTGSLEATEKAAADVQKTPNRVSLASMEAKISQEHFVIPGEVIPGYARSDNPEIAKLDPLNTMTLCILVMENGFTLIGKSAPADPGNFNAELGKKFAREDAIRQLWPLEGYALREKLSSAP